MSSGAARFKLSSHIATLCLGVGGEGVMWDVSIYYVLVSIILLYYIDGSSYTPTTHRYTVVT